MHKGVAERISSFPGRIHATAICDGDAKGGVAIHDGDADLDFRDLTVEVPGHEALPQQFHAVHLRLDAASAVVSAPVSPDGATEVFRRAERLVARNCTRGRWLPRRGVFAGRDDGVCAPIGDRLVASTSVIGAVGGDAADLLIGRNLTWQSQSAFEGSASQL